MPFDCRMCLPAERWANRHLQFDPKPATANSQSFLSCERCCFRVLLSLRDPGSSYARNGKIFQTNLTKRPREVAAWSQPRMSEHTPKPLGGYPTTRWTLIFRAKHLEKTQGREALGELFVKYREPLLVHLRWKFPYWRDRAEDWLQGFVADKIMEYELLKHAEQGRGRFRTFLLKALDNYVFEQLEKEKAAKRTPQGGFVFLDHPDVQEPAEPHPPRSDPGDVEWARKVLAEAVRRTQTWFEERKAPQTWQAFYLGRLKPKLDDEERPSDAAIAEACGIPVVKVANTINNGVRKFRTVLRSVIGEYTESDGEVIRELQIMIEILARAST